MLEYGSINHQNLIGVLIRSKGITEGESNYTIVVNFIVNYLLLDVIGKLGIAILLCFNSFAIA